MVSFMRALWVGIFSFVTMTCYLSTERTKAEALKLAGKPARPPRGLAMYAVPETSRFALAKSIPQAHDVFYQRSSMPVSASTLWTH